MCLVFPLNQLTYVNIIEPQKFWISTEVLMGLLSDHLQYKDSIGIMLLKK